MTGMGYNAAEFYRRADNRHAVPSNQDRGADPVPDMGIEVHRSLPVRPRNRIVSKTTR